MKKIFALIVMMIFMFSVGTMAYAAPNTADTIKAKKETIEQKRQEMQAEKLKSKGAVVATDTLNAKKEAVQKRQELKAYLQTISNQIKTNRAEILQLKAEARIAQKAAAAHIKELKKSPDKLTEAQIAKLQDAKVTLKKSRTELAKSVGEIKKIHQDQVQPTPGSNESIESGGDNNGGQNEGQQTEGMQPLTPCEIKSGKEKRSW